MLQCPRALGRKLDTFINDMSIQDDDCESDFSTLQTVTVGRGQAVGFRTQQGNIYGKNTKCKVNFKVNTALTVLW